MPRGGHHCCVVGCKSNSSYTVPKRRFFRIPAESTRPELREKWIDLINRAEFKVTNNTRICDLHFVDNEPTYSNPLPVLKMGYTVNIAEHTDNLSGMIFNPNHRKRKWLREPIAEDISGDFSATSGHISYEQRQVSTVNMAQKVKREFELEDETYKRWCVQPETRTVEYMNNFVPKQENTETSDGMQFSVKIKTEIKTENDSASNITLKEAQIKTESANDIYFDEDDNSLQSYWEVTDENCASDYCIVDAPGNPIDGTWTQNSDTDASQGQTISMATDDPIQVFTHPSVEVPYQDGNNDVDSLPPDTVFVCPECDSCFQHRCDLETHVLVHAPKETHVCGVCGESYAGNLATHQCRLETHVEVHPSEKRHVCGECGGSYVGSRALHIRSHVIHVSEKAYVCRECGASFAGSRALLQHFRIHTHLVKHKCEKCGKVCNNDTALKSHMIRIHQNEKAFTCKECGKNLHDSASLEEHMQLHTRAKPFVCRECGRCFRLAHSLAKHMDIHVTVAESHASQIYNHENPEAVQTPNETHMCQQCGEIFAGSQDLHACYLHTDETQQKCEKCGKKYNNDTALKSHMFWVHQHEEPFACKECGKKLRDRTCLEEHLKLHTVTKPFACKSCGRCFKFAHNLAKHLDMHIC